MPRKDAKVRTQATGAARKVKGDIYRSAYQRARRAINAGFYLEAIVLIESMLADRLEALLSIVELEPAKFRTANEAARDLKSLGSGFDEEILEQISAWSRGRSRWVHEFAKVSDSDHLTWRARLADAREVAVEGFDLATRVTAAVRKAKRTALRDSSKTS